MTSDTAPPATLDPSAAPLGQTDLRHFRLRYNGHGDALVEVGGTDVTHHVKAVHIDAASPSPHAFVVLELIPTAGVEFEGLARVGIGEEPDPGPAAARFLAAMDPVELERLVLARTDLDPTEPASLTAAMLRQLQEFARGGA